MTNFNFTFQPGMSSKQIIGFEMAGRIWSQYLQDDIVINVHLAETDDLPPPVVGGALPAYVATDITTVQSALAQDRTSPDDDDAIGNLNSQIDANGLTQYSATLNETIYQSSNLSITQANAKALGLESLIVPESVDGYILVNSFDNSSFTWDYDFSRTSASSSRQIDYLSMALHELGHLMGFISGVDVIGDITNQANLGQVSLLDLFRYSDRSAAFNALEFTAGQAAYFSIDGGQTQIAPMAEGLTEVFGGIEGYQASHWAYQPALNSNLTPDAPDFDLTSALLDLIDISAPVTPQDAQLAETLQLADFLNPDEINIGAQTNTTVLGNTRQATYNSLGIMAPALVPGFRSSISNLDLRALDVIGYDLKESPFSLDYSSLLQETQASLVQDMGVVVSALDESLKTSPRIQDRQAGLSETIANSQNLFERRRSGVRTRRWVFWQEDGLDPTVVNIVSDGAADSAQIAASEGRTQVTTIQAIPYVQLFFRSDTLVGSDADDYIYPISPADEFLTINAGKGNNLVVLGSFSAEVTAAEGADVIIGGDSRSFDPTLSMGYTVDAGEGDNYIFLTSEFSSVSVSAGEGDDYITLGSDNNIIEISGGNNQIHSYGLFDIGISDVERLVEVTSQKDSFVTTPSSHKISTGNGDDSIYLLSNNAAVTTTGGHNIVHIQGEKGSQTTLTSGDGNDEIILMSDSGVVAAGSGNNVVTITSHLSKPLLSSEPFTERSEYASGDDFSITTGTGDDIVRLSVSQANVMTGGGNDIIDLVAGQQAVTTGVGNDLIILGDLQGSYTRYETRALITDFSENDTLLLHGKPQDYQMASKRLFYRGQQLADFESDSNFSLEHSQVFFTDTAEGNSLARQVGTGMDIFESPRSPLEVDSEQPLLEERYDNLRESNRPITYRIIGGDDAGLFSLDATTGKLQFKTAPDAGSPLDANGDSIYDVIVQAILGEGKSLRDIDAQQLAIKVLPNLIDNSANFLQAQSSQAQSSQAPIIQGAIDSDVSVETLASDQLLGINKNVELEGGADANQVFLRDANSSFYTQPGWNDNACIEDFKVEFDELILTGTTDKYAIERSNQGSLICEGGDHIADIRGAPNIDFNIDPTC